MLGDWDGNGRVNPGVRDPATRVFTLRVKRQGPTIKFGKRGDLPIAGNWDGVGAWEVGVRRPGSAKFLLRAADGTVTKVALGDADDLPVTGDWDGNGITDLGVFDPATAMFTLRPVDAAGAECHPGRRSAPPATLPVVGDWDGNGITDLGTWSPDTQTFYQAQAAIPDRRKRHSWSRQFRAGDGPALGRRGSAR